VTPDEVRRPIRAADLVVSAALVAGAIGSLPRRTLPSRTPASTIRTITDQHGADRPTLADDATC
jgi:hypothetical protein